SVEEMRQTQTPDKLLLLAELEGELVGSGVAGRSDLGEGLGFVAPRVLPDARRGGVGSGCSVRSASTWLALGSPRQLRSSTIKARLRLQSASASVRSAVRSSRCGRSGRTSRRPRARPA